MRLEREMAENVEDKAEATQASIAGKRNIGSSKQSSGAGTGPRNCSWTALQQHISGFDLNKDGILYPWETYAGLRGIGWNVIASTILTIVFNVTFSYASLPGWVPSLLFPVYIENIHKNKHGDDTENYDKKGSFFSDDFEMLLSDLCPPKSPNKLKLTELWKMPVHIIRWIKEKMGWKALYFLARLEAISLSKEADDFDRTLYMARKQAETKVKSS
ncbi:peroxygenase 1-like [Coffea arabica]|uniref:Peroxygenase 1-like n=1 Tax=Coffea arabica TaxID=13443 RepID=A0A6P6WXQ6_COFAR